MAKRSARKSIWRTRKSKRGKTQRFRLPGGNRALYVSEEKYPRLWQWIQMNEA